MQITLDSLELNLEAGSGLNSEIVRAALQRAIEYFGSLHSPTGNLWDTRDQNNNLMLGKFTYNTVAGILPGTTLEQHGALEHHAREILGQLDENYVVDQIEQVVSGRTLSLMGYVSGGSSSYGMVAFQLDPQLMYLPMPQSDRVFETVSRACYLLIKSGMNPLKPTAFHAEINNRYGFSRYAKLEHDRQVAEGRAEHELPRYKSHIYITMPHLLQLNEDLIAEDLVRANLLHWSRG
ncbi:MAG: hypothetical protein HXX08_03935 [Chloroflexi bacterium]|uniref:Uncharacterized protein n=1 Tax=Candidatus Chlorohelix allophototropha TaxID=3003348 RepID=A0A8T7LZL2_9CHLR|nr:hypothetical protein [Chloroflexota bacterium]WJW66890.1 hypothetical protein OZ401_000135 [Chloroflexota bacterium L227-S17]